MKKTFQLGYKFRNATFFLETLDLHPHLPHIHSLRIKPPIPETLTIQLCTIPPANKGTHSIVPVSFLLAAQVENKTETFPDKKLLK